MFSISPATSAPHDLQVSPFNLDEESPYFWGNEPSKTSKNVSQLVRARTSGYEEARSLIGNATMQTLDDLVASALTALQAVFEGDTGSSAGQCQLVDVRLSDDLVRWRKDQHKAGHILPSKGKGLKEAPLEVLQILGIGMAEIPRHKQCTVRMWMGQLPDRGLRCTGLVLELLHRHVLLLRTRLPQPLPRIRAAD